MTTDKGGKMITNGYGERLLAGGLIVAGSLIGQTLGVLYSPGGGEGAKSGGPHSGEEAVIGRFLNQAN